MLDIRDFGFENHLTWENETYSFDAYSCISSIASAKCQDGLDRLDTHLITSSWFQEKRKKKKECPSKIMLFWLNRADSRRSLLRVSSLASFTEQWSIGPEKDKIDQPNYRLLFLQYEIDPGPIMLPSKLKLERPHWRWPRGIDKRFERRWRGHPKPILQHGVDRDSFEIRVSRTLRGHKEFDIIHQWFLVAQTLLNKSSTVKQGMKLSTWFFLLRTPPLTSFPEIKRKESSVTPSGIQTT